MICLRVAFAIMDTAEEEAATSLLLRAPAAVVLAAEAVAALAAAPGLEEPISFSKATSCATAARVSGSPAANAVEARS